KDVDFNRDVRPILAANCVRCHGHDDKARKAGLRLDTRAGAIRELKSGSRAVVPGRPDRSELYQRITSQVESERMPPARTGKRLSANDAAVLKRWIEQGAPYDRHWAYIKPVRPAVPDVHD